HISIMVVFFNLLFRPVVLLPRGHIILNIVMIIAIWGYACVVGLSESVLRSAAMFMVLQIAWALGELYSGINGLCVAVLGCVIVSPTILYSVGFQLSVIAVASIFLWGLPLYYRFFGGGGALISALCISACCCVATMPIVSYIFGYVPILGVVFSPLYILCMAVIIAVGMTWIIFPLGIFDAPLRLIIESVALILEGSVDWVASKSWGFVEWQMSLTQLILIYLIYIVITLLVWWNKNEKKRKKSNINL
ncbi:MAG: ComEC/Rec2 family competence protein, partial [Rikenellaceae bacterium]